MSKSKLMADPRYVAVFWLTQVVQQGVSVNQLMAKPIEHLEPQDRGLAKQLLFGSLRFYHQLTTLANNLLNKPLKPKDTDVMMVLVSGLYQLKYLAIPDHASISESVELAKKLKKDWAAGLVNGVLRHYQREGQLIETKLEKSVQFQFSHPGWMVKRMRHDWPEQADDLLQANNQQAPMILRVNTLQNNREDYLQRLNQVSIRATEHSIAPDALVLESAMEVTQLPGFSEGLVTVQDAAAQLAVEMLDLKPDMKVLDGCAAPGGKTTHLLQRCADIQLTAVEMSANRAERIEQTLNRMQMQCVLKIADICDTQAWWDGEMFDRILLDVPCSASGVIRRNPDIKIHRLATDMAPLVEIQQAILEKCWSLLKPGGKLVYATCSIFKEENESQIESFLQKHSADLLQMPSNIHDQLDSRAAKGYQIFPGEAQMDGFYLCGLQKPQ